MLKPQFQINSHLNSYKDRRIEFENVEKLIEKTLPFDTKDREGHDTLCPDILIDVIQLSDNNIIKTNLYYLSNI